MAIVLTALFALGIVLTAQMVTGVWARNVLLSVFVGGVAALIIMRHFLPRAPVVSQVMLAPPDDEEMEEIARREAMVQWEHLLGKQGRTTTPLMPAGKARFGDELIDVISQGEVIDRDTNIRVLEVLGNRVIVEPVEPT